MSDIEKKFFEKIPIDKLYEDLFQPGLKKAGQALETVLEFGLTILLPIKLLNEKAKIRLKINLEKYNKKLSQINENSICKVPEHIGLPIVDKLLYLDQEDLANAFINLLTKASSFNTINLVHPSFLNILNNLCPDEAKILNYYKNSDKIPFIDLHVRKYEEKIERPDHFDVRGPKSREQLQQNLDYSFQNRNELDIRAGWNMTGIENLDLIDFPVNIDIYIENLAKQGLIAFERSRYHKDDESTYERLENLVYRDKISEIVGWASEDLGGFESEFYISKGYIEFTELGKAFIKACIKD